MRFYIIWLKLNLRVFFLDILIFSFVITSHLIFSYYFLPIELLIGLSGANILYTIFKKLKDKKTMKDFMKYFIIGIGEVNFLTYLIYMCMSLAPLFHIFIIGAEVSSGKMIIIILSLLWGSILTFARIYSKLLKWIDQLFPIRYMFYKYYSNKNLYMYFHHFWL